MNLAITLVTATISYKVFCSSVFDNYTTTSFIDYNEYCPTTPYCKEGTHVMCLEFDPKRNVNNDTGSQCPQTKNMWEVEYRHLHRIFLILNLTNGIRGRAAMGIERGYGNQLLPRGYGLWHVEWDDELATFARFKANTCTFSLDLCRATSQFPNPGQIVYASKGFLRDGVEKHEFVHDSYGNRITSGLKTMFKFLFSGRKHVTKEMIENYPDYSNLELTEEEEVAKAYLQVVYANVTHMGCGYSFGDGIVVENGAFMQEASYLIVCNFSHQPRRFLAVYPTKQPTAETVCSSTDKMCLNNYNNTCGCLPTYEATSTCLCTSPAPYPPKCRKGKKCTPSFVVLPIITVEDAPYPQASQTNSTRRQWVYGESDLLSPKDRERLISSLGKVCVMHSLTPPFKKEIVPFEICNKTAKNKNKSMRIVPQKTSLTNQNTKKGKNQRTIKMNLTKPPRSNIAAERINDYLKPEKRIPIKYSPDDKPAKDKIFKDLSPNVEKEVNEAAVNIDEKKNHEDETNEISVVNLKNTTRRMQIENTAKDKTFKDLLPNVEREVNENALNIDEKNQHEDKIKEVFNVNPNNNTRRMQTDITAKDKIFKDLLRNFVREVNKAALDIDEKKQYKDKIKEVFGVKPKNNTRRMQTDITAKDKKVKDLLRNVEREVNAAALNIDEKKQYEDEIKKAFGVNPTNNARQMQTENTAKDKIVKYLLRNVEREVNEAPNIDGKRQHEDEINEIFVVNPKNTARRMQTENTAKDKIFEDLLRNVEREGNAAALNIDEKKQYEDEIKETFGVNPSKNARQMQTENTSKDKILRNLLRNIEREVNEAALSIDEKKQYKDEIKEIFGVNPKNNARQMHTENTAKDKILRNLLQNIEQEVNEAALNIDEKKQYEDEIKQVFDVNPKNNNWQMETENDPNPSNPYEVLKEFRYQKRMRSLLKPNNNLKLRNTFYVVKPERNIKKDTPKLRFLVPLKTPIASLKDKSSTDDELSESQIKFYQQKIDNIKKRKTYPVNFKIAPVKKLLPRPILMKLYPALREAEKERISNYYIAMRPVKRIITT